MRGSLERYRFGSANDDKTPKHKLSKSEVRVGMTWTDASRTWDGGKSMGDSIVRECRGNRGEFRMVVARGVNSFHDELSSDHVRMINER